MKKKELNQQTYFEDIPQVLPILPLKENVVFPYMIFPILVGRDLSINAAKKALEESKYIFLSAQKNPLKEEISVDDLYLNGSVARIIQTIKLPNGLLKILVDGVVQGKIVKFVKTDEYFAGEIKIIIPIVEDPIEINALVRNMTNLFKEYVKINKNIPGEALGVYEGISEPDRKLFYVAANLTESFEAKQRILEKESLKDQIYEVIKILNSEIGVLKIEKEIEHKVQENIAKSQRRYIIQEQIRILQNELGEDEEISPEIKKIKERIKKAKMPKHAREKAYEELNKLKKTPPISPESTVIRNYLDWLCDVPWSVKTKDNLNIANARKILDEDHYGLEKAKDRIIEYIAVLNLTNSLKGQILCFVGPPGVGKTSLGKSIARALGRNFARISLGGLRDEAEIRGHRRTYVGAIPGKIIYAMKKAGTINPVILLDEIDKMSSDFRGDPAAAMLEVLDPEQNHSFNDHYLEVDYDLSNVFFITTANVKYNIPAPLLDRMEIIELPGYLTNEKIQIAIKHIIPKQINKHGLNAKQLTISEKAVEKIALEYVKEAGVRNLEREIAAICRKSAKQIIELKLKEKKFKKNDFSIKVDELNLENYLGIPRYKKTKYELIPKVGIANGLAWTSFGGEVLKVEALIMEGKEKITLTGQLGEVMKESALAALSLLRSSYKKLNLKKDFYKNIDVHIHIPEGAIPKDGPSAGITLFMAMLSAFSKKPARGDVAMTGEITLSGLVLPIGGLNEKLLAAKMNNIMTVIVPKDNEKDLTEMPKDILEDMTIISVENVFEAAKIVFKI